MNNEKVLSIGSNGYFFIDGFHVTVEEFEKEENKQTLRRIENKLDFIIKEIKK